MKALKIFSLLVCTALICYSVTAQTNQSLNLKNSNNKLFAYGYQGFVSTTNGTATTIASFTIGSNEAGLLEAEVVGFDSTNGDRVTGTIVVAYKKTGGTLTLASPDTISTISGTGGLSAGTFAFSASSNNILLKVTGASSKNVDWIANVRWIKKTK